MSERSNKVVKSKNDRNKYCTFTMENKLNVFVESNKYAKTSCVMLIVNIGYIADTIEGTAHFLEHMLFNGTEKYPEEKYFSNFIIKSGGTTNAFTTYENTCYYYTTQSEHLNESLEIFSNFFKNPLLREDSISREREAVNSEHDKNIHDDDWRFANILKRACNQDHPYSKFSTGSNSTLDVQNISQVVKDFFDKYYSAHKMTLVVVTSNSIKSICPTIKETFGSIPIRNPHEKINIPSTILNIPQTLYVVPISDINTLTYYWEIPSFENEFNNCPIKFISSLIEHEGSGTLHDNLTKFGYILELYCGMYEHINDKCIFMIDITLSEFGVQNKNDVICMIFSYLDMIKNTIINNNSEIKNLYEEKQLLNKYSFKFSDQYSADDKCMVYYDAISRYKFNLKYLLAIHHIKSKYDMIDSNLLKVMNILTENNCITMHVSPEYTNLVNKKDIHYGTDYKLTHEDNIIDLVQCRKSTLPKINPYISVGYDILKDSKEMPIKIDDDVYWYPTNIFLNPDVNVKIGIYLPISKLNSENYTKMYLYISSILLNINAEKYMCTSANYDIHVIFDQGYVEIEICGNYEKIDLVCKLISDSLLFPVFTESEFLQTIYSLKQSDLNLTYNSPYTRVTNFFNKTVNYKFYDNYDRLKEYDKIKYDDMKEVFNKCLQLGLFNMLISGNCNKKLCNKIINIFDQLKPKIQYVSNVDIDDSCCVENSINIFKKENKHESNNAVGFYIYIDKIFDIQNQCKNICMLEIISKIIHPDYFYELRTQEKFGYIVGSNICSAGNFKCSHRYFKFIVQSKKKSVTNIINRTKQFIITYRDHIEKLTEKNLNKIKKSCIKSQQEEFINLNDLAMHIKTEIDLKISKFNLKEIMINSYKQITLADIKKFYDNKFMKNINTIICIDSAEKLKIK